MPSTPLDRHAGPPHGPAPEPRRRTAVELGVLQGVYVVFLAPWFVLGIGGTMAVANWDSVFAAPIFYAWWCYPLVALATTAAAWARFAGRQLVSARRVNRVPLAWVLVGVALMIWIATAG